MGKSGSDKVARVFATLLFCVSAVAAAFFAMAVYEIYCERSNTAARVGALAESVAAMKRHNEYQKDFHARLINDEEFAARVIRETLGYSAENEIIFKFDEKTFASSADGGVSVERAEGAGR